MFLLISVIVPLLVYAASPRIVSYFGGNHKRHEWMIIAACTLFFVSWYLPSPLIDGRDTSFMTHLVGGGLFTSMLWLYFKYALGWRAVWWLEGFSLFALVSALGYTNELFELFMVRAGLVSMTLADTNWDILANTAGAVVIYVGYLLYDSRYR